MAHKAIKDGIWTLLIHDPGFAYHNVLTATVRLGHDLYIIVDKDDEPHLAVAVLTENGDMDEELDKAVEIRFRDGDTMARGIDLAVRAHGLPMPSQDLLAAVFEE